MPESKTKDISVRVENNFQEESSNPVKDHFVFSYRVTIHNLGEHTVKLLSRKWDIIDSNTQHRKIEGEGVVGRQPVLEPGQSHEYVSGCNFQTDMGKMKGHYIMEKVADGEQFDVDIPEFHMVAPYRLN